jgi:hypothetical protein
VSINLLLLSLSMALWSAQAQPEARPPDSNLLERIRIRMAQNLNGLPNYTCLETIERSRRKPAGRKFEPLDRVRLEVALVEGKEVFGWPGGEKIAESEITNLVSGTIGNGDFALFLKSIFLGAGGTFHSGGETTLDGKRAMRFDYAVPLSASGYHLRMPPRQALVPYHGSFWVNPESLDLMRLELVVDAIPPYLGIAAASDSMDYGRVDIGGSTFLLPQRSELDLTDLDGRENRNHTRFTACRQFTGESTLSFADVAETASQAQAAARNPLDLPNDLESDFSLMTPIDPDSSAVGDLIRAKLDRDIRAPHQPVIPKGAQLVGRIARLERLDEQYALNLAVTAIEFGARRADLTARENTLSIQIPVKALRAGLGSNAPDGPLTMIVIPTTIPSGAFKIPAGSRMNLRSRLIQSEK